MRNMLSFDGSDAFAYPEGERGGGDDYQPVCEGKRENIEKGSAKGDDE